jgi:hypothetical protein
MPNTALCPSPRLQFLDVNGEPLAGGLLYSYAAGTSTPQATYQDANGAAANTNPVVLDAGGFANVWLAALTYKLVLQNASAVVQWTQDNVSAVSLAELQANNTFASITVTGNAAIGGNETVAGLLTAASATITGSAAVQGNLTAATAAIAGNETVGGTLGVTGATTLGGNLAVAGNETVTGTLGVTGNVTLPIGADITVGGVTLTALIAAAIGAAAIAGNAIIPNIGFDGTWVTFQFGTISGTIVKIAIGAGQGGNGFTITPPAGFNTTNFKASAAFATTTATPGNELLIIQTSVAGATISVTASDTLGHNFVATASWWAICWLINQT